MQEQCHRCGGELAGETTFCPHCGAPQLTLALEQQSPDASSDGADAAASSGTAPPPRLRAVDWRVAITYAAGVAAIGAVLSGAAIKVDMLSLPSTLWLMSASMITLGLYQRRLPAARIDAGIGARIGLVVGLCLAVGLAAFMAGWGVVERYALHGMGSFDAQMAKQMAQALKQAQEKAASQQQALPPWFPGFANSPEFRAGGMLFLSVLLAGVLMVMSVVGGAFGGLLRTRRR